MKKFLSAIVRFFSKCLKWFRPKRRVQFDTSLLNPEPDQLQISENRFQLNDEPQGILDSFCHPATLFPDSVGDINGVFLEEFQKGKDTYFFYREDYENYTEIEDGRYIIKGYDENGVLVGNWLVSLQVIGSYDDLKAIVCFNFGEVPIIKEVASTGPDGLDMTICYFKFSSKRKTSSE